MTMELLQEHIPALPESLEEQAALLELGAAQVLPEGGVLAKLKMAAKENRPLRIKLGLDPTAPDIHLGHSVVLARLRMFQDAGHQVVLIIGDYTARVGDPSGKSKTRPTLDPSQIDAAAATYAKQAFKVLDPSKTELRYNSQWLDMRSIELFELMRSSTVAQILEREDFSNRMEDNQPISILELLYPLIQGFDSVAIEADVELGGTDQTFNLLLARDIQRHYDKEQQVCLTMPILTGTDGVNKMSKSLGNYIGVTEKAEDIFGKTMSIPDENISEWATLLFGVDIDTSNPYTAKRLLAASLAERFAGPGGGQAGSDHFDSLFKQKTIPTDIPTLTLPEGDAHLPALVADAFGVSRGQARREIGAGGVKLDGNKVDGAVLDISSDELEGQVLQLGKRRFVKLVA